MGQHGGGADREGRLTEPHFSDGVWWFRQPDGTLLRWDTTANAWLPAGPELAGPEAPGAAAPPGEPWQPIAGRAKAVRVLLFITAAVALGAAVSDILEIDLLDRIEAGELVTDSETTNNDNRVAAIGLLQIALGIATAVLFIMWFSRAYRNVERLGATPLRFKPGWAIGAWFVPILNLFRPKQIADDIWRGSDPDMKQNPAPGSWHDGPIPRLLFALWWLFWVVSAVSAGPGILGGDSIDEIRSQTVRYLISDVATIPAALLCAAVVGRTTKRQEARARAVG